MFAVLALFGVVLWIAVWRWLPETLSADRRATAGPREAVRGYRSLLGDRQFLALAVIPGLGMGALISYVLGSPFVLQEDFGLTAQLGNFSLERFDFLQQVQQLLLSKDPSVMG